MRIVEIREMAVPMSASISNALVDFSAHTVSLIAVVTDVISNGKPLTGLGFNSIGRFAQSGILKERMFPRLQEASPASLLTEDRSRFDPAVVLSTAMANEKPGGHGDRAAAAGGLELAFWDLNAKLGDEPAWVTIARDFGPIPEKRDLPVYAAGGYYHSAAGLDGLSDELKRYRDLGFADMKIKIGGASFSEDIARIEKAIEIVGDGRHLSVDANGRFDRDAALRYGREIEPFGLRWYEEAGDPLDYELNKVITENYRGAIATGENLFSVQDVKNLLNFGGMRPGRDFFQMDPGLSYGLTGFRKMVELAETRGFDRKSFIPHGGHLINLHVVAGLNLGGCEAYPQVFEPFGGYTPECLLGDGHAWPTDAAGFGLEEKADLKPWIDRLLT